jgi:C4-dicarboxylate transporter DctM subunit
MILAVAVCFSLGIILGIPLIIVLGLSTILPGLINPSFMGDVQFVIRGIIGGGDNTSILAAPLFILSGIIMARGGISEKIFNVFAYLFGRIPGGMPSTVVLTCLFYGAISGSGTATCAAVGAMTIPILLDLGYDRKFVGALVASAAGLGVIIPPSIPFIMYGLATGASVGALFIAGIIPGLLIATCLIGYVIFYCILHGEDREKIDEEVNKLKEKGFFILFKESFWALLTPVILLGGIYSGIVTPTEVACISVVYSLIISIFVYKTVKVNQIFDLISQSTKTLAPLALMFAIAIAFGRILTLLKVPGTLADFITNNFSSKIGILIMLNVALLVIGMIMDTGPALMILAPMLLPLAQQLGINPIHLGIIMVVNMAIGFVTPPFGVTLFVTSPMVDVPPLSIGRASIPFIITLLIALVLITFIPQISLLLI